MREKRKRKRISSFGNGLNMREATSGISFRYAHENADLETGSPYAPHQFLQGHKSPECVPCVVHSLILQESTLKTQMSGLSYASGQSGNTETGG